MTFINVASQRDNLGDSLLRRPLIRAAQRSGECHVFVGTGASDWTNLGLRPIDRLYTSRRAWTFALMKRAATRRTALALNAGELLPDRRFLLSRTLIAPAIALVKLRGGALIHAGFGLRDPKGKVPWIARSTVRLSDVASWRDEASRAAVGSGTAAPDWAFSEGASSETLRERHAAPPAERVLSVSLRGDRPLPSPEWVANLREVAESELGARVVVVCQVRRDAARAEWLAGELAAELVDWPETADHSAQEERVREIYSRSTWIASNRLHSVIMAVTEGAIPLDLVPDQSQKVPRALAVVDLALFPVHGALQRLTSDQSQLRAALGSAQERLADLSDAIASAVRGDKIRRSRVLHTVAAPDRTTRYARHMAATEDIDVRPVFLNWRRALFGNFDVVHVHWPEHLVPAGSSLRNRRDRALAAVLIRRVKRNRTPIVRTLHNLTPHRESQSNAGEHLRNVLDELTRAEIHLVPGDPQTTSGAVHLIPHGSYREPYADVVAAKAVRGQILHFGRLEAYKGVPELLQTMEDSKAGALRIVGSPSNIAVADAIKDAARKDPRISYQFGFVADGELAGEINRASLCVFPYRELHSSGAVLVALSLNRPILVPRTPTTEALQAEVGTSWVRIYDRFDADELDAALEWSHLVQAGGTRPELSDRSWQLVRERHASVTRSLVGTEGHVPPVEL